MVKVKGKLKKTKEDSVIVILDSILHPPRKRIHYTLSENEAKWFNEFLEKVRFGELGERPNNINFSKFIKILSKHFTPEEFWNDLKIDIINKHLKTNN